MLAAKPTGSKIVFDQLFTPNNFTCPATGCGFKSEQETRFQRILLSSPLAEPPAQIQSFFAIINPVVPADPTKQKLLASTASYIANDSLLDMLRDKDTFDIVVICADGWRSPMQVWHTAHLKDSLTRTSGPGNLIPIHKSNLFFLFLQSGATLPTVTTTREMVRCAVTPATRTPALYEHFCNECKVPIATRFIYSTVCTNDVANLRALWNIYHLKNYTIDLDGRSTTLSGIEGFTGYGQMLVFIVNETWLFTTQEALQALEKIQATMPRDFSSLAYFTDPSTDFVISFTQYSAEGRHPPPGAAAVAAPEDWRKPIFTHHNCLKESTHSTTLSGPIIYVMCEKPRTL